MSEAKSQNAVVRAEPLDLDPGQPLEEAVSNILDACLTHWVSNAPAILNGDDAGAVKQMRVGLRRYRSALTVFKSVFSREETREIHAQLKEILNLLAPVRDRDVFLNEILAGLETDPIHGEDLAILHKTVRRQRDRHVRQVHKFLQGKAFGQIVDRVAAWTHQDGPGGDTLDLQLVLWHRRRIDEFAPLALEKRHRLLMKTGRNFAELPSPRRHDVRIALKKMRYVSEFFATLYPSPERARFRAALRRLQDDLGHLNDLAVAEVLITQAKGDARSKDERLAIARAHAFLSGWYGRKLQTLEPAMVEGWKGLARQAPFWREA